MQDPTDSVDAANAESAEEAAIGGAEEVAPENAPLSWEDALRERVERLQVLRSAWGVLAPSVVSEAKQSFAAAGRALADDLTGLQGQAPGSGDPATLVALDPRFDDLERQLRTVALEVPVSQLRSTLPARVGVDRRGVLDLLDLILGAELLGEGDSRSRVPTLDYLITLLCNGGDPEARLQDPVMLTPRLHALCERAGSEPDASLPGIEAEFFAAAEVHRSDVEQELELRTLRRRKVELGPAFFAPGVLRAIMTYNAALLKRIDAEVWSSQDWGMPANEETPDADVSVFEHPALPRLVDALLRREAGEPPALDPIDRIAWCLDVSDLGAAERDLMLSEPSGRIEKLQATTVLVSLLCRSAIVLDREFPAIGLTTEQVSGAWVREVEDAFQQEANQRIAADDYEGACALTDMKSRLLSSARADARRSGMRQVARPAEPAPAPTPTPTPKRGRGRDDSAREARMEAPPLADEALESIDAEDAVAAWREAPWARIGAVGAAVVFAVFALVQVNAIFAEGRVSGLQLTKMSPYLAEGKRNADGTGTAFVGTLDAAWHELEPPMQKAAAERMVQSLRAWGLSEIMIYDGERQLRIQALGGRPPTVVLAEPAS